MKKSRIILVATCILALLSIIITQHFLTPNVQPHASVEYYKIAEQHEQDKQWRKARSAWLRVKAEADSISQNTSEANGRQAYCDYRIAMTYHNEGNNELAIANLKLALATPASDINQFMGRNGTTEMQNDLMEVVNVSHK
ncbi:MAG TPA: hypothetical protein DCM28_03120 [Phycisphaerales bacterium]|nr:hypothetical protein [Phycisphaerales bacterium]HCD32593.1 hypothetical protein [Phycisphaerales bacterium]|tara:strand:+ start:1846 stop:2265 length:420 start_codon:yes stop_codon:yes gene_type:complete